MSLSRKRRRELKRLRSQAEELLDQQRIVLGHAGSVLQEAGRQAKNLGGEYVTPRVNDAIEGVRPTIDRGVVAAHRAADRVRRVAAPIVATALANTIRTLEQMENPDAAGQLRTFGEQRGLLKPSKNRRVGGVIALGLGVVAAAGVGYALWQAFRSDDELWVAPEGEL
ncbi:DNA/RNA helicase [Leucobacter sp. W1038]|uniref:DNA/RNA helicase n=1 Tax=Leucobacter sp. W1038 TaxID=3438281 RepID=UPI003D952AB7